MNSSSRGTRRDEAPTPTPRRGLCKYVARMRMALSRRQTTKRQPPLDRSPATAEYIPIPRAVRMTTNLLSTSMTLIPTPATESIQDHNEASKLSGSPIQIVMRSKVAADRARKLAERYALPIDPIAFEVEGVAYRVEKTIRVRIHRSCHLCYNTLGACRVCSKCQHLRCKLCPRWPPKQEDSKEVLHIPDVRSGPLEVDLSCHGSEEQLVLPRPIRRAGSQPLVNKKPKQRVRRRCHECSTTFSPGARVCPNCQHVRCVDCPRDPPKKHKYPNGYPGDAPSSNTSKAVLYSCHQCRKVFPPVPHPSSPEGIALQGAGTRPLNCDNCQHLICPDCPRAAPQKAGSALATAAEAKARQSIQEMMTELNVADGGAESASEHRNVSEALR